MNTRHNYKAKGFTLIELVVVVAIIGVLTMILVPTFASLIEKSQKKATVTNGKTVWLAAVNSITSSSEAYKSFYTKAGSKSWCYYTSSSDGRCGAGRTYKNKSGETEVQYKSVDSHSDGRSYKDGRYDFSIVIRADARNVNAAGKHTNAGKDDMTRWVSFNYTTWSSSDNSNGKAKSNDIYGPFLEEFLMNLDNSMVVQHQKDYAVPMPYRKTQEGGSFECCRWLVTYRFDDPEQIEVWAGDGYKGENGPVYRVYPNPHQNYVF